MGERTYIVRIGVPNKRPNHIIQSHDNPIPTPSSPLKGITEIMRGILQVHAPTERNPAGNRHKHDDNQLDHTKEVLQSQAPLDGDGVDEEGSGHAREADAALVPAADFDVGCVEDVFAEDDAVAGGPAEEDHVGGEHGCCEEAGFFEYVFEVVLFAAVSVLLLGLASFPGKDGQKRRGHTWE